MKRKVKISRCLVYFINRSRAAEFSWKFVFSPRNYEERGETGKWKLTICLLRSIFPFYRGSSNFSSFFFSLFLNCYHRLETCPRSVETLLRYDILPSTFLFIREENISWAIVGGSSRKITFSRVKLPLISRCVINFTRTNASREIPRRRGASCDVSERNGARSSSTTVLFSLAQVVYSRDKPETGRYVRSIHPTESRPCRAPRENLVVGKPLANLVREKWRTYTRGEGEGRMVEGVIFERRVYRRISFHFHEKKSVVAKVI